MSEGGASWVLPTTHSDLDTKKAGVLCPGEELHQGVSARWGWGGHKPPSSSSWGRCRNQRLHQWSKAAPSLVGQRAAATVRSLEGSPSPSLLDRLAPTALATRSHDMAARSRRGCPPPAGSSVSPEGSRQGPGGRVLAGWRLLRAGGQPRAGRRGPGSCCILGTVSPYFSDTLQPDRAARTCLASLALPLPHPHTGGEGRAQV